MFWAYAEEGYTLCHEKHADRKRGRPKKRYVNAMREDMQAIGVIEEDTERTE